MTNKGRRVDTHPSPFKHKRIIRAWRGSFTAGEIAIDEGIATITVYMLWHRAKAKGLLPKRRRPTGGF